MPLFVGFIRWIYVVFPNTTPGHIQWISNTLLHLSWATQTASVTSNIFFQFGHVRHWGIVPLNAVLNYLLASCIFLGHPVKEEVLKIQAKSYVFAYLCPPRY